jgi:hypothetical protein
VYLITVLLLMAVLPIGSIVAEHVYHPVPLMPLVGKWFVFWGAGVRLSLAGLRQILQPRFTAERIFHIKSDDVLPFVRELGVANLSTGIVGVASLFRPDFVLPIAIIAAMFYGVAGLRHATDRVRGKNQSIAMVSDILVSLIYLAYIVFVLLGRRE